MVTEVQPSRRRSVFVPPVAVAPKVEQAPVEADEPAPVVKPQKDLLKEIRQSQGVVPARRGSIFNQPVQIAVQKPAVEDDEDSKVPPVKPVSVPASSGSKPPGRNRPSPKFVEQPKVPEPSDNPKPMPRSQPRKRPEGSAAAVAVAVPAKVLVKVPQAKPAAPPQVIVEQEPVVVVSPQPQPPAAAAAVVVAPVAPVPAVVVEEVPKPKPSVPVPAPVSEAPRVIEQAPIVIEVPAIPAAIVPAVPEASKQTRAVEEEEPEEDERALKIRDLERQMKRMKRDQKKFYEREQAAKAKVRQMESELQVMEQKVQEVQKQLAARAQEAVSAAVVAVPTRAVNAAASASAAAFSLPWDIPADLLNEKWTSMQLEMAGYSVRVHDLNPDHPLFVKIEDFFFDRDMSGKIEEGYEIERIEVIDNELLNTCFVGEYTTMKHRRRDADTNAKNPWRDEWMHDKKKPRPSTNMSVKMQDSEWQYKMSVIKNFERLSEKNQDVSANLSVVKAFSPLMDADEIMAVKKEGFLYSKRADGIFGNGCYVTPQSSYAFQAATGELLATPPDSAKAANLIKKPVLLLSYVLSGTIYPITRNSDYNEQSQKCAFTGANFGGIYDTHFVQVAKGNAAPYQALKFGETAWAEEIVVKSETQVLPRFILYLRKVKAVKK